MAKIIIGVVIGLALAALAYYVVIPRFAEAPTKATTSTNNGVCAQVLTSARNPSTGQIKVFPTPCDVPKGWEVIVNEVPGL